ARMNFAALARAAGIESAVEASTPEAFAAAVAHALGSDGPHFIWCRIEQGRANVPPFPYDELENKYRFIRFVEETTGKRIIQPPIPHSYEGTLRRAGCGRSRSGGAAALAPPGGRAKARVRKSGDGGPGRLRGVAGGAGAGARAGGAARRGR